MSKTIGTKRLLVGAVAIFSLLAASCTDSESDSKKSEENNIILTAGLERVDSCDALLEKIKAEAIERVGPYGFNNNRYGGGFDEVSSQIAVDDAVMESADSAEEFSEPVSSAPASNEKTRRATTPDIAGDASTDGAESFTGTNNQELEVDEADIVKTDGKRILVVQNQKLYIVDAKSKDIESTVKLPDWQYGGELFIHQDTALLMSQGNNFEGEEAFQDAEFGQDYIEPRYIQTTNFSKISLNSGKITGTYKLPGNYLSAREVNGTIRAIVSTTQEQNISFVYPSGSSKRAQEAAEKANKTLVETSEISDWIPVNEDGDLTVDCENVYLPKKFAGFGLVNVVSFDIENNLAITDSVAIFTSAQDVYSSKTRLVVSTPEWNEPGIISRTISNGEGDYKTALHTFDISEPGKTEYVASGKVKGTLLSRYSISEHDGYIRVATTEGSPWGRDDSESIVTVLEEDNKTLVTVGEVDDIGRGERIFAVRFQADIAYVVTFRQTDPFYTIDLSNPENPQILGELKIPGFSSYLHPVDENTVLAVGTDGDENGQTGYPVASVFDVSDLSNPELVSKIRLSENRYAYSLVANDPRAFQFWDSVALIPVDSRGGSENQEQNELVVVELDNNELTELGRISHPAKRYCEGDFERYPTEPFEDVIDEVEDAIDEVEDTFEEVEFESFTEPSRPIDREQYCYTDQPGIVRSLVIGDNLYSVSSAGIKVNNFDTLDESEWIAFN